MKLATLANASVVHTRRWVEHFRARGHDVRVYSLEPGWNGDIVRLPALPLPASPPPPPVPLPAGVTLPQPASNTTDPTEKESIHPRMRIAMIYGRRVARLKVRGLRSRFVSRYAQLRY